MSRAAGAKGSRRQIPPPMPRVSDIFGNPTTSTAQPCSNEWYDQFFADRRGRKMRYNEKTSKRIAQGLGLTDFVHKQIVTRARVYLPPTQVFHMGGGAGRKRAQNIGVHLKKSTLFGRYFRPKREDYCDAAKRFFAEAATLFAIVANDQNRAAMDEVLEMQAQQQQAVGDVTVNDQDTPTPATVQPTVINDTPMTDADEEDVASEQGPEGNPDAVINPAPGGHPAPQPTTRRNYIQLQSDDDMAATACMCDLFRTADDALTPMSVNIEAVRNYWNRHQGLCDEQQFPHDQIQFQYYSPTHQYWIHDDITLQMAFRDWQSIGNEKILFILYVDEI